MIKTDLFCDIIFSIFSLILSIYSSLYLHIIESNFSNFDLLFGGILYKLISYTCSKIY